MFIMKVVSPAEKEIVNQCSRKAFPILAGRYAVAVSFITESTFCTPCITAPGTGNIDPPDCGAASARWSIASFGSFNCVSDGYEPGKRESEVVGGCGRLYGDESGAGTNGDDEGGPPVGVNAGDC